MKLAKCFSLYNDVEEYIKKYGDEDPRTHNKITEWGLCVCNNTNNKDVANRVQACLSEANEKKADQIASCESELLELDDVVNREVTKFRIGFEGSVSKISELCGPASLEYSSNIEEYGSNDEKTILSAAKLSHCAAPLFCKSATDQLARCASSNDGNLANCNTEIEAMIKCTIEKVHQPVHDFTDALRTQLRSYEPLPPQKNPTCKLNKKDNKKE
jgi:hypothetical protein